MSELTICNHGIIQQCCAACAESEPPVRVQRVVRRFRLHWKHGDVQEVTTENTGNRMEACAAAMNEAGIGGGALRALDYWEEIAPNDRTERPA